MRNILIILLITLHIISCEESPNEPENNVLLDISLTSTDSVQVRLDGNIICEGKINYSGILGTAWSKRYDDLSPGIHEIYYKSYLFNKETEHNFYLGDTLTVMIYYSAQLDKIMVITRNNELWLE